MTLTAKLRAAALIAIAFTFFISASANAAIIYNVNRIIDGGSITGFIETDGTLGVLGAANITDWSLNLASPNLAGGPTDTIEFSTAIQTSIAGTALTATATDLLFDFDAGFGSFLLLQGASQNFWCLDAGGCSSFGPGELMGLATGGVIAEQSLPTGIVAVGTTAAVSAGPVPEPGALAILGTALAIVGISRRRRR